MSSLSLRYCPLKLSGSRKKKKTQVINMLTVGCFFLDGRIIAPELTGSAASGPQINLPEYQRLAVMLPVGRPICLSESSRDL